MKFSITKESFLKGLQQVQSVVSVHSTLPILFNVMIKADKQGITLTTTDLAVSMRATLKADVKRTGESTFSARRLLNVIRELPHEDIEVEVSDSNVASIQCGSADYKIFGMAATDFPALPSFENSQSITTEQAAFKEMLKKTAYAASIDESRQILNGIMLSLRDQKLTMVATDGRRLALIEQEIELSPDIQRDLIVPTKTVNELIKILDDEGTLKIQCLPNMIAFDKEDVLLTSKLIEGNYPNYKQVIPSQCEERLSIDRENLLAAVRRVSFLASDKNPSVKLTFTKNQVQIVVVTPDVGEAHESIPIKYTGKSISMAFNPEYLMDPLRNLTSDEVAIELVDELSPAVIKCDLPFLYVLMPLRLN